MKLIYRSLIFLIFLSIFPFVLIAQESDNADGISADGIRNIQPLVIKYPDFIRFEFKSDDYVTFSPLIAGNMLIIDFDDANNLDLSPLARDSNLVRSFGSSPDSRSILMRLQSTDLKLRKFIADDFTTGFDLYVKYDETAEQAQTVVMSSLPDEEAAASEAEIIDDKGRIIVFPREFVGPPTIGHRFRIEPDFVGPYPEEYFTIPVYEVYKTFDDGSLQIDFAELERSFIIMFPFTNLESVGAATLVTGNKIQTIFDNNRNLIAPNIGEGNNYIKSIKEIEDDKNTRIEVEINDELFNSKNYNVFTYRNKFSWVLEIVDTSKESQNQPFSVNPASIEIQNLWGENRIVVSGNTLQGPVKFTDHLTGEEISGFTFRNNATGVSLERDFVDLKILQSPQGIFFKEKADLIDYTFEESKLIVSKLPSLHISDEIAATGFAIGEGNESAISKTAGIFSENSILPFPDAVAAEKDREKAIEETESSKEEESSEQGEDEAQEDEPTEDGNEEESVDIAEEELLIEEKEDISEVIGSFITDILNATDDKISDEMYEMARFYFAYEMYPEASGLLYEISNTRPDYEEIIKVKAALGAADFLNLSYAKAKDTFDELAAESINNVAYNEIKLWLWVSSYMNNKVQRIIDNELPDIDFANSYDKFMKQYPKEVSFFLGIQYVDYLLKDNKIDDAGAIFDLIKVNGVPDKHKVLERIYAARLMEAQDNSKAASVIYKELTEQPPESRKERAYGIAGLARYQFREGEIDTQQAIDQLLTAATIWRDDFLELEILEEVGELYLSINDYENALQSWKNLVLNFPKTGESIFVLGKMKKLFIDLFDEGLAYELEPLEALEIYFKFRELMPVGETGDRISQKIVDYFINADMIDDAIEVMDHQIKYRSSGEEKARLIMMLADILDKNRKSSEALEVLQGIDDINVSRTTKSKKKYKRAYILARLGRYQESLDLILNDFSEEANDVRIELFWNRQNWFGIMNIVEPRAVEFLEGINEPLNEDQIRQIMRLAVAYSAQGLNEKLKKLEDDYASLITDKEDSEVFEYLTSGQKEIDYQQFEETVELEKIERFLNEYSFLPKNDWINVIEILKPKVAEYIAIDPEDLSRRQNLDIIELGLAYASMIGEAKEEKIAKEYEVQLLELAKNFKDVRVDRFTIEAFSAVDNKIMPIDNDAIFEGRIRIGDIPRFIEFYKSVNKISDLNKSVRNKFEN
jgi:tetratricopeptide (TPR) repeat protein